MKKFIYLLIFILLLTVILIPAAMQTKKTVVMTPRTSNSSKPTKSHSEVLKAIDEASENRILASSLEKQGNFEDAAAAYIKAYEADPGSRAVSGLLLAATYEKLSRFDDGILLLDQMIQNGELNANGIKNANEIKARLISAKNSLSS